MQVWTWAENQTRRRTEAHRRKLREGFAEYVTPAPAVVAGDPPDQRRPPDEQEPRGEQRDEPGAKAEAEDEPLPRPQRHAKGPLEDHGEQHEGAEPRPEPDNRAVRAPARPKDPPDPSSRRS